MSGRGRQRERRRPVVLGGILVLALVIGLAIANRDRLSDTLREVTLPLRHEDIVRQQAADKGIPPDLIAAVIWRESRFRDQTSEAGARGLMQVTPKTAKFIERHSGGTTFKVEDLSDPQVNISYGTYYLDYLLEKFHGNLVAGLAAYNAGETNVIAWGGESLELGDIEFGETRDYVEDILDKRDDYARHYESELGLK